jgi:YYY domain-containing protein
MSLGLKALLTGLLLLGICVCAMSIRQAWTASTPLASVQPAAVESPSVPDGDKSKIINSVGLSYNPALIYTYLLLLMGLCICLGIELVYVRDFLEDGDYERMNTVFKFSLQAWLCFGVAGALVVYRLWNVLKGWARRLWMALLTALVIACSVFLVPGTTARIADHQFQVTVQKPVLSPNYTPTLDGFDFVRAWYPGDAKAIAWLNAHISGSPTILEAVQPASYTWVNRVSVYTGLPDVLGWSDHVGEQRYGSQPLNREADINMIYSTQDSAIALQLLHYYHVRYVYVGGLERDTYAQNSSASLDKFAQMQGLHVVYRSDGVAIYEVE